MKHIVFSALLAAGTTLATCWSVPGQAATLGWQFTQPYGGDVRVTGAFFVDESALDDGEITMEEVNDWTISWSGDQTPFGSSDGFTLARQSGDVLTRFHFSQWLSSMPTFRFWAERFEPQSLDSSIAAIYIFNNQGDCSGIARCGGIKLPFSDRGLDRENFSTTSFTPISAPHPVPEPSVQMGLLVLGAGLVMRNRRYRG